MTPGRRSVNAHAALRRGVAAGLLLLVSTLPTPAAAQEFRAGIASREVNPLGPTVIIGPASSPRFSDRYLDLKVGATVIEDAQGGRVAIISADTLFFTETEADALRSRIAGSFNIGPERVLINASHTHSAPPRSPFFVDDPAKFDADYAAKFNARIVEAVGEAVAAMRPATLTLSGDVCDVTINRRRTNKGITELKPNPDGSADREVAVLALRDPATGTPFGVVVKYACHPVTTSMTAVGPDYPGFMAAALEGAHAGLKAQFVQGCSGDCRPRMVNADVTDFIPGSVELCKGFGEELAKAVERSLEKTGLLLSGSVAGREETLALPVRPAPRSEYERFAGDPAWHLKRWGTEGLQRLAAGPLPDSVPLRVQVLQIGDGSLDFASMRFVALGGEVFSGYAQEIERMAFPFKAVALGYSNGMAGYIPTAEEMPKGGYEVFAYRTWNTPGPFMAQTEAIILDSIRRLTRELMRP